MFKERRFSMVNRCALIGLSILLLFAVSTARGYTINNLGNAGGWDDIGKRSATTYVLDRSDYTSDSGLSESQITTALTNAFDTWSAVENSSLVFIQNKDTGQNYDVADGPEDSNGPPWFGGYAGDILDQKGHYLYANVTFGGWLDNSYFDYLEDGVINGTLSNILAVTWTGQIIRSAKAQPQWIAEIFFNDGWTWNIDGPGFDIETVMLHELGHGIGLGHESLLNAQAVMNPVYAGTERELYQDDIDGLVSLYPPEGPGSSENGKPPWASVPGGPNNLSLISAKYYNASSTPNVPEPATLLLFIPSLAVCLARFRKRR